MVAFLSGALACDGDALCCAILVKSDCKSRRILFELTELF
jgi:hypothetical protein